MIKAVARVCAVHPRLQVHVEGHVGIESPDDISTEYSVKRAEAVAQGIRCMMPTKTVKPQIGYKGYGKSYVQLIFNSTIIKTWCLFTKYIEIL